MFDELLAKFGTWLAMAIGIALGAFGTIDAGLMEIQTLGNELVGQVLFYSAAIIEVVRRVKKDVGEMFK